MGSIRKLEKTGNLFLDIFAIVVSAAGNTPPSPTPLPIASV